MGSLRRSSLNLFLISLWSIHQLILTFQGLKAKKKKVISFLSFLPPFFSNPWLSTLISTAVGSSHQCTHTDSAEWQRMLFKAHGVHAHVHALVSPFHFNSWTFRSALIKDTESLVGLELPRWCGALWACCDQAPFHNWRKAMNWDDVLIRLRRSAQR